MRHGAKMARYAMPAFFCARAKAPDAMRGVQMSRARPAIISNVERHERRMRLLLLTPTARSILFLLIALSLRPAVLG